MELTRTSHIGGIRRARRRAATAGYHCQRCRADGRQAGPSFYRYKVGDVQVTVISDGVNTFPLGDSFVLNAKKDEVAAALEKAYMPKDKVSIQFGPLVINSGGKLIVLDTGNGPGAFASSKGNVGQFATNMAAAGFDPKAVDMVVISHFHGDHINGCSTPRTSLAFANAEVLVPSVEWKYFMDDGEDGQTDR
jgi:glyoxylase-like metal-dependent hydrolase (beta-lactamase superfamily II)